VVLGLDTRFSGRKRKRKIANSNNVNTINHLARRPLRQYQDQGLEQAKAGRCGRGEKRWWEVGGYFFCGGVVGFGFGVEGAVAVEDLFAGDGGDAVAGDDDACQVHRVGG